jgi:excisionase family DNA binding protein
MPKLKNIVTQQHAAQVIGVTDRTVRNWISQGLIIGYRLPSGRGIRVDLTEITEKMTAIPATIKIRQPFGPSARIVDLETGKETDEGDEA